jgi:hypothetical protein
MNTIRSWRGVGFLALALLVMALAPASASAQSVFKGHFTLPVETVWGSAILPAGEYSFTMESLASPYTITVRGENNTAMINVTGGIKQHEGTGQSVLVIARRNGRAAVNRVYLEPLGTTFYYGPEKGESRFLAEGPNLMERLPLTIEGK